jgi:hypothetical protein
MSLFGISGIYPLPLLEELAFLENAEEGLK